MRVTMNTMYDQINADLFRLTDRMQKTTASISSGKIYRTPSDEPVALVHALGVRSDMAATLQYQRNISYAKGWTHATESALSQVQDRLLRAKELAIQGANDTLAASDRRAIAAEVERIQEEVAALGNTSFGGRYVFGGTRTKGYGPGEAPFVLDRDGRVTYHGNREGISVETAPGIREKINLDGDDALVQGGVFTSLDLLRDALEANSQSGIQAAIGDIDRAIGHVSDRIAVMGATANSLENKEAVAEDLEISGREHLSDIEDADLLEAVSDLKAQETGYQAALSAASRVMSMSLVDYLR